MAVIDPTNKQTAKKAGPGRPRGVPNKTTKAVKDMILAALDKKGGVEYLARQADANPAAFMTLVGKVLPLQLTGSIETVSITKEQRDAAVAAAARANQ